MPGGAAAVAGEGEEVLGFHVAKDFADELGTGDGELVDEVSEGEGLGLVEDGLTDEVAFGGAGFDDADLTFEFLVRVADEAEEEVPPGDDFVFAFVPAARTELEDPVVLMLAFFD